MEGESIHCPPRASWERSNLDRWVVGADRVGRRVTCHRRRGDARRDRHDRSYEYSEPSPRRLRSSAARRLGRPDRRVGREHGHVGQPDHQGPHRAGAHGAPGRDGGSRGRGHRPLARHVPGAWHEAAGGVACGQAALRGAHRHDGHDPRRPRRAEAARRRARPRMPPRSSCSRSSGRASPSCGSRRSFRSTSPRPTPIATSGTCRRPASRSSTPSGSSASRSRASGRRTRWSAVWTGTRPSRISRRVHRPAARTPSRRPGGRCDQRKLTPPAFSRGSSTSIQSGTA